MQKIKLKINDQVFNLHFPLSREEKTIGLSNRLSLEEDSGMFFLFKVPGKYQITMEKMKFSLDVICLDKDYKILETKELNPGHYFIPTFESKAVLELPQGSIKKANIRLGDEARIIVW